MTLDGDGLVRRAGRWVALSDLETRLVGLLLAAAPVEAVEPPAIRAPQPAPDAAAQPASDVAPQPAAPAKPEAA